jgi:hypothetical protein
MHLSVRSELKTELADSRIETKLPINEVGLLHVCLTDARFTCGCDEMSIMQEGPACAADAYDQADGDAGDHAESLGASG